MTARRVIAVAVLLAPVATVVSLPPTSPSPGICVEHVPTDPAVLRELDARWRETERLLNDEEAWK